jgi:hypothetical protein
MNDDPVASFARWLHHVAEKPVIYRSVWHIEKDPLWADSETSYVFWRPLDDGFMKARATSVEDAEKQIDAIEERMSKMEQI